MSSEVEPPAAGRSLIREMLRPLLWTQNTLMNPPIENVLVIRRSLFDQLGSFQGLNFEPRKYLGAILSRGNNFFLPRPEAEINPAYKQIIPYVLIAFENKVLITCAGKKRANSGWSPKAPSASAVT